MYTVVSVEDRLLRWFRTAVMRLAVLLPLAILLCRPVLSDDAGSQTPVPYRFLLVISDQWKDPASYLIEGAGEFQTIATLLMYDRFFRGE